MAEYVVVSTAVIDDIWSCDHRHAGCVLGRGGYLVESGGWYGQAVRCWSPASAGIFLKPWRMVCPKPALHPGTSATLWPDTCDDSPVSDG